MRAPDTKAGGRFRPTVVALATLLTLALCAPASQAAGLQVPPHQALVALLATHVVRDRPNGRQVSFVRPTRPITGERTVLPVLARRVDRHGRGWLQVRLPGRVLGSAPPPRTGWIRDWNAWRSITGWHIVVDRGARRVDLFHDGRRLTSFQAIVGKPSTPTPSGEYFVEENVQLPSGWAGAPFALATSDRSNVLQEFDGGPGQIALHGLDNVGGRLGTAESHGCIRLADSDISWLAARIAPGVPVTII